MNIEDYHGVDYDVVVGQSTALASLRQNKSSPFCNGASLEITICLRRHELRRPRAIMSVMTWTLVRGGAAGQKDNH